MAYTTINKSSLHFNTKTYTGNASTQAITGVGFQPDWVWIKNRDTTNSHVLQDAVRGADKTIYINADNSQDTGSTNVGSFDSDGFTLGSNGGTNGSGNNVVSWNWKANGSGSSNSDGSITSTVSANQTAGFSIVQYVATSSDNTVGHGLNAVPKMIITKSISHTGHWSVYHHKLTNGTDSYIELNNSNAESNLSLSPDYWGTPSTTTFGIKGGYGNSVDGRTYIAYCFAEKIGYSKFGKYVGNSDSNYAPFIYTGFKPSFVFLKNITNGNRGVIYDNQRIGYNPSNYSLGADITNAEESSSWTLIDFYSNGFRPKSNDGSQNGNANKYMYMAFGQSIVGSNNVPCTAR